MTSSRPYLVRALYEWIVDNGCTPHVLVDAHVPGVEVPQQYVKNGQIVLNVSPTAVADLVIGNEDMRFRGRFGGIAVDVVAPTAAIHSCTALVPWRWLQVAIWWPSAARMATFACIRPRPAS